MNYKELTGKMVEICREAKDFILENNSKVSAEDIEFKSLNSLVSYVDKGAEEILVKGLKELLPEAGFIAEEDTETTQGLRYNWVIDPLDGTTNFLHGLPVYAISLALVDGEEPVCGVVWELCRDELFTASLGDGCFLNGNPVKVTKNEELQHSLLATGFPYYDFGRMSSYLNLLEVFFRKTRGVRRLGSAATDLAYVACGRFDAFFEYGLSPWDVAAGVLLVKEAGGTVSDFKGGNNYIYGSELLASTKALHNVLLSEIQEKMEQEEDS